MRKDKVGITKRQAAIAVLTTIFLYFVFHAVYGNRGVIAYFNLIQKIEDSEKEVDILRADRLEIEHKVKALRSESLDGDMLDEQARKSLGVVGVNEKAFVPEKDVIPAKAGIQE